MKELSLMPEREDRGNLARALDRLFQLPLAEFTAARNELAKAAGSGAADVRALQKPSAPAWAVNQLYWRERRVYETLVRASDRLRAAHTRAIGGKKTDLSVLELQHQAAVKAAANAIRTILSHAGDPATPATMAAVVDTLQALPGGGTPGHLNRPLAPLGFGALGALMKGAATPKTLAEVISFAPPKPKADERAEAERQARVEAGKRLKDVEAQLARVGKALAAQRAAVQRAERAHADLDQKLQRATASLSAERSEATRLDRDRRALEEERVRLKDAQ
jgi:predicted RNase H-like nuclease (RuvC/YqgF family)